MATKLPSFLRRAAPAPISASTSAPISDSSSAAGVPAAVPVIFRARAPVLLARTAQPPAAPQQAQGQIAPDARAGSQPDVKPIFRSTPPVLVASPAPDRAAAAAPEAGSRAAGKDLALQGGETTGPGEVAPSPAHGAPPAHNSTSDARAKAPIRDPSRRLAATLAAPVVPTPARGAPRLASLAAERTGLPDPGNGFRVVALPRLAAGGRWRTEAMRSYSAPVLIWFTRGQGRITIAGSTRGFGAHNAVFLPPGTMHGFEMTAQVFGSQVTFPRDAALMLPDRPHHLRFRDAAEQNELSQMIDNLQREIDRDLPVAARALAHHAGLMSVWLERQILKLDPAEAPEPAAKRLVAAFTALVEEDVSAAHSVADFAARLGVTPTHLTRSCKLACGRSAHDILSDRVFFEARRLLRDTSLPIKRIASSLGFASPAYFTRAFQKATQETPTRFRRRR